MPRRTWIALFTGAAMLFLAMGTRHDRAFAADGAGVVTYGTWDQ